MTRPPAPVVKEYLPSPFGQVHLRRSGAGGPGHRALLCLHLTPGSGRMYTELLGEMGHERLCLAPDTPGFGASDPPDSPVGIPELAAVMSAVLDEHAVYEVDVVGYHTGSKIAVELALREPDRVKSLVLVSAPVYSEEEMAEQRRWLATPRIPRPDGSHLVAQFEELVRWTPEGTPLELIQREFAEQQRGGANAHWGYLAAFSYSHAEALPKVRAPVLLLCPGDDLEVPTLRARDLVGNGRFLHLPDWGHQLMITHTREVADLIRAHSAEAGGTSPAAN